MQRPWEIWLVHHTHVDIGYTEPQDVILRRHAEFVAQALDHCTATDCYPVGERFCWTCEVAWTIRAFMDRYPERQAEFLRRVREGRIEVTALYLQLTDLFTHELLEDTTDYAITLARRHDFEIVTAMNSDVNGWAWGLPDLLARRGVRYMDTAINETRARGVRPRPTLLRWTGPQGGSLLFWHSHGYLTGNNKLGLTQTDPSATINVFLERLVAAGYPHHVVQVHVQGANHDNAPPGLWLSERVHAWNARGSAPRLRLVTSRAWFEEAAAHWPTPVVEHRAAWPDWWADGNGSAAYESALVRQAQADLLTLKSLTTATGRPPPADRVDRAREAAAFFCEHTWGAWCSTDAPDSLTSKAQWNTKAGFAYTAAVETGSLVREHLANTHLSSVAGQPELLVFNPLGFDRSDLVTLLTSDEALGLRASWVPAPLRTGAGPAFHLVDATSGATVPVAREPAIADSARRSGQTLTFLASNIPANSFRRYRVVADECPASTTCETHSGVLRNPALEITTSDHGLTAVRDRSTGADWVRDGLPFALGEVVYETIPGPFGRETLCGWGGIRRDTRFVRTALTYGSPTPLVLPYGAGLRLTAKELPGSLRTLELDVVVYDNLPRVDLHYRLEKTPSAEAEALYVAFPLCRVGRPASDPASVWLDVPGAAMRPGVDQVPGTATDWHSVQHYFAVGDASQTVVVATPDIPLVQVNGINTGLWQEDLPVPNGLVVSWVMNNYWFTNFPATQGGSLSWRYSLCALPGRFDPNTASAFARTVRQPLVATVR